MLYPACILSALVLTLYWTIDRVDPDFSTWKENGDGGCVRMSKLAPEKDQFYGLDHFRGDDFRNRSLEVYAGSIRIPTEGYDDMGPPGEDARWNVFFEFEKFLQDTFPLIYEQAEVEHINTHGLIYTFEGSDSSLKPLVLMAHRDVVPVPPQTYDWWTHPPYSGYFDGEYVWGRGSSDCKNTAIGVLEALTALFEKGFTPKRTIVFSLGADEESGGPQTAYFMGKHLHERYGDNSVLMIVDEGDQYKESHGAKIAAVATGEKGNIEVKITLTMPGGHSSIPPDRTSIGILSRLIAEIEEDQYENALRPENPYYTQLKCLAASPETTLPKQIKKHIARMDVSTKARKKVAKYFSGVSNNLKYLMQTTQAADIIQGGIKINALPENVAVQIDHRIAIGETSKTVTDKTTAQVVKFAKQYNMAVQAFGEKLEGGDSSVGVFTVELVNPPLEPAPISPSEGNVWDLLGGTIRHMYEDFAGEKDVIVAPGIMTGNTDTKHYWPLTKHIFRFSPSREDASFNIHTIDEHVSLDNHVEGVVFYHQLILNADSYEE
ncbi:carboxypeptidase S [Trichomonascus vanleenenianus]|uniref:M20 family metallopeptidase n=1 Tax=Trichomonascus vanleenenianus TaxID=2268995 RepID=UPI003ECA3C1D